MFMVATLPDLLAGRIPQPVDAARREGLEGSHDLRQTMIDGVSASEQHNSMNVVGITTN